MRRNKSKQFILAALTGMLVFSPVHSVAIPETVYAAQVPDTHDSKLAAFDIAPGVLSPAFSPDVTEYTATVDENVTDVSVQAVPRASGAVIASIEGRNGLKPGVNTITATCSAQDNTVTVYKITLTVGSAGAGSEPPQPDTEDGGVQPDAGDGGIDPGGMGNMGAQPDGPDGTGNENTPPDAGSAGSQDAQNSTGAIGQDGEKADKTLAVSETVSKLIGKIASDGTVTLNGAAYRLSGNFNYSSITQDIPSAFGQGSVKIKGNTYPTLYCGANKVHLVYMENTDGNGATGFYFYDKKQKAVERFKYAGSGDQFVVFLSAARKELPPGFAETVLELPSGKEVAAYQDLSMEGMEDYYLVYGIHSSGSNGWYLYDKRQGTYMRYSNAFAMQQEENGGQEEVARTVSLAKYNTLNEKYTELKKNRVRIVSILAIAIVLLIIVFTAVLLRGRDDDGGEEKGKPQKEPRAKAKKARRQPEAISKSSLAAGRDFEGSTGRKSKKVTKTITREPADEARRQPSGAASGISTPEEIRAQMGREQDRGSMKGPVKKGQDRMEDTAQAGRLGAFRQEAGRQGMPSHGAYGQEMDGRRANVPGNGNQPAASQETGMGHGAYARPIGSSKEPYSQPAGRGQGLYAQPPGREQEPYAQPMGSANEAYAQPPGREQEPYSQPAGRGQEPYAQPAGRGQEPYAQPPGSSHGAYAQPMESGQGIYRAGGTGQQAANQEAGSRQGTYVYSPGSQGLYGQAPGSGQGTYAQGSTNKGIDSQQASMQGIYSQEQAVRASYAQNPQQQGMYVQHMKENPSAGQEAYSQRLNGQEAYGRDMAGQRAYGQAAGPQDSVQLAAEKMRQTMKYSRKAQEPQSAKEHDPMDDWDMDEAAGRKAGKGKPGKKKRGLGGPDVEIMDLNDL